MEGNDPQAGSEEQSVWSWRFEQLLGTGYSERSATRLASAKHVDLELARRLIAKGCTPAVATRILL